MIRLVDDEGNPFWIRYMQIDAIFYCDVREVVILQYHSGSSCCEMQMAGTVNHVMRDAHDAVEAASKARKL